MVSRFSNNGVWRRLLLMKFPSYNCYCTTTSPTTQTSSNSSKFFTDYLIRSLGFSPDEALAAAKKVRLPSGPPKNDPDLLLLFFQNLGLTKTQIKSIVSTTPRVLFYSVDKTIVPKIRFLQDLGLSGSDIVRVLTGYKSYLTQGLENQIRPPIDYLRNLLGSDKYVVKAIKRSTSLLHWSVPEKLEANVSALQNLGISRDKIIGFVLSNPNYLLREPRFIKEIADKAENEYGVSPNCKMFYYTVLFLSSLSPSTIEMKFGVLRSFGLSDADIYSMVRKSPSLLGYSEARLRKMMEFYTQEHGCAPEFLASRPVLFNLSLEKRVKPRCEVFKILKENNLAKESSFYKAICVKDSEFVERFLLPHKDKLPELYASYTKTVELEEISDD